MGNGPRDATPIPEGLRAMVPGTPSQPQSKEGAQQGLSCEESVHSRRSMFVHKSHCWLRGRPSPARPVSPVPALQRWLGGFTRGRRLCLGAHSPIGHSEPRQPRLRGQKGAGRGRGDRRGPRSRPRRPLPCGVGRSAPGRRRRGAGSGARWPSTSGPQAAWSLTWRWPPGESAFSTATED